MFHFSCYWNNSGFKNTWSIQSCYCSSLSFRRSDQNTELPGQGTWDFVLHCHLVSPAEPSHELLPTRSCSSLVLFFLPITSHRATSPSCFMPRKKVQPFQGPQTAWFRLFLFSWSFKVCFSFSAPSAHWFCPQNGPPNPCVHYPAAHLGKPTAAKNRIFWTPKLNLPSHTATSTSISTKENKQWCSLMQEIFRNSLHYSYRILVAQISILEQLRNRGRDR